MQFIAQWMLQYARVPIIDVITFKYIAVTLHIAQKPFNFSQTNSNKELVSVSHMIISLSILLMLVIPLALWLSLVTEAEFCQ